MVIVFPSLPGQDMSGRGVADGDWVDELALLGEELGFEPVGLDDEAGEGRGEDWTIDELDERGG